MLEKIPTDWGGYNERGGDKNQRALPKAGAFFKERDKEQEQKRSDNVHYLLSTEASQIPPTTPSSDIFYIQ